MSTLCNFNAGPAMLPPSVLERVQGELRDYQGRGMSIMEMSHRSREYEAVNASGSDLQGTARVGDGYRYCSSRVAPLRSSRWSHMNFLTPGATADYLMTGAWLTRRMRKRPPWVRHAGRVLPGRRLSPCATPGRDRSQPGSRLCASHLE